MKPDLSPYGLHRSIDPPGSFPQQAWRLDSSMPCQENEIEIDVERLHLDASSFRQLREQYADQEPRIREAIMALVKDRGKLHNPRTNSGGILIGRVKAVGARIENPPPVGSRIATLVSLSLTPLRLAAIHGIDLERCEIAAGGIAYLFQTGAWALLPADLPESVSLAAFDVAGAPARVKMRCRRGDRVVIFGAGRSGVLSAVAASECGAREIILIDVDAKRLANCEALKIPAVSVLRSDARDAAAIAAHLPDKADLTVSCVDAEGIEPACVVATKPQGHVLFFSMVTNFARAALCAEGMGSAATLEIGNGLAPNHAEYVIHIMRAWPQVQMLFAKA
jgi:L-erythro-3,5-diaminohexanoate dehydrogenase